MCDFCGAMKLARCGHSFFKILMVHTADKGTWLFCMALGSRAGLKFESSD